MRHAEAEELDDKDWDELPVHLQNAAAQLGYCKKLWDNDEESDLCDIDWAGLTSEQRAAAELLGYTPQRWDAEVESTGSDLFPSSSEVGNSNDDDAGVSKHDSDRVDSQEQLEHRIKKLQEEISQRQQKLKKLVCLKNKKGTAYERMLQSHEDCVNSHLQEHISGSNQDLRQNRLPDLKQGPLQFIRDVFVNEYYHTLPGCMALSTHCLLYITLYTLILRLTNTVCHHLGAYLSGWHIIHNNYDDTREEHIFFLIAMLFSFFLARITGSLYDWNENRKFQRKLKFHFRNRWHMRYWDVRVMNWFSGGEIAERYNGNIREESGLNRQGKKLGPRLKRVLDIFSYFLCYCCIDHFVIESGPKTLLDVRDVVLEGLPSRQLQLKWTTDVIDDQGIHYCVNAGSTTNHTGECLNPFMMDDEFTSDILNWVKNSDRCGWALDDDDEDDEEENEDDFSQKDGIASDVPFSFTGPVVKTFQPWKQADKEWRRKLNTRDDEYLRANISMESYYSLVGDPHADFVDPVREQWFLIILTGISFVGLNWYGVPFLLI